MLHASILESAWIRRGPVPHGVPRYRLAGALEGSREAAQHIEVHQGEAGVRRIHSERPGGSTQCMGRSEGQERGAAVCRNVVDAHERPQLPEGIEAAE